MRRQRDALDILRSHVLERHLRASLKAQDIGQDPESTPRMSIEDWVSSCGLVRGIEERTLQVLHTLWVESPGTKVESTIVELAGGSEVEVQSRVVAQRYTLAQAATRHGLTPSQATTRLNQALQLIGDALWKRMEAA
jgi:hypothetical protein